jgi:hypothetical protein
VGVQFGLAGLGVYQRQDHHTSGGYFEPHATLGTAIGAVTLVLLLVALLTRQPRGYLITAVVLFGLAGPIQPMLSMLGSDTSAWFGALHALVGFVIAGLVGSLLAQSRRHAG